MLAGDIAVGAELARKGLEIAGPLGLDAMQANLLNTLGVCEASFGDIGAFQRLNEAFELAERSGDPEAILRIYVNLPDNLFKFGQHEEGVTLSRRGREVARRLGSPNFEWFIAANEATMLMELGRYDEAEPLLRESLESHAVLTIPGQVNAKMIYGDVLIRQGRYAQARLFVDEAIPLARRIGGSEFLTPALVIEASLDEAQGSIASARQILGEAIDIAVATSSLLHLAPPLAPGARLLSADRVKPVIERARPASGSPMVAAAVAEAEAWLTGTPKDFTEAARRYADMKMPYQEARCLLEAGNLERARELIAQFRLEKGPLGTRLGELSGASTGATL
jgi:tetratricopeptide (TPR) repeat protein